MSTLATFRRLAGRTLNDIDHCSDCGFGGRNDGTLTWPPAFKREATGIIFKGSRFVPGDWRQAIVERQQNDIPPNVINKRNVNDFLKHVPCGVLAKGTEFFHVTKGSSWVTNAQVGGTGSDFYSFFTLRSKGFASTHSSDFTARIQLRLKRDLPLFFMPAYNVETWNLEPVQYAKRSRIEIKKGEPNLGNAVVRTILSSWPSKYRPTGWACCSECEILIHNDIVGDVLDTTAIAKSANYFKDSREIVHHGDLPANAAVKGNIGIAPPEWMNPAKYHRLKVEAVENFVRNSRTNNWDNASALFQG